MPAGLVLNNPQTIHCMANLHKEMSLYRWQNCLRNLQLANLTKKSAPTRQDEALIHHKINLDLDAKKSINRIHN
jgi:hypothetical protein